MDTRDRIKLATEMVTVMFSRCENQSSIVIPPSLVVKSRPGAGRDGQMLVVVTVFSVKHTSFCQVAFVSAAYGHFGVWMDAAQSIAAFFVSTTTIKCVDCQYLMP